MFAEMDYKKLRVEPARPCAKKKNKIVWALPIMGRSCQDMRLSSRVSAHITSLSASLLGLPLPSQAESKEGSNITEQYLSPATGVTRQIDRCYMMLAF